MEKLSEYFKGVSSKLLSNVEIHGLGSNQHEFNGVSLMREYLGDSRRSLPCRFLYIGSDEDDRISVEYDVTWYDARERHLTRSEYRLYYPSNEVMARASIGNIMISALDLEDRLYILIVDSAGSMVEQVLWLFGINSSLGPNLANADMFESSYASSAVSSYIADEIGFELVVPGSTNWLDLVLERFGAVFPSTRALSDLAEETLKGELNLVAEPDLGLITLLDREWELFRTLEQQIVSNELRVRSGAWSEDVDSFISYSLSVANRRKTRAGYALENHMEKIFLANSIYYTRGGKTEGKKKPDFILPSIEEYLNPLFTETQLTMLGAKTTCKDRWRQVLTEAERIGNKHLLTLQPGISVPQLDEMAGANLTLVVPKGLHDTFDPSRRNSLMSFEQFIDFVRFKQA